jgi:uncharacterized Zn finger protein (UPF0148 family)
MPAETITLHCQHCGNDWESRARTQTSCPRCGKAKRVPAPSTRAARAALASLDGWASQDGPDGPEPTGEPCPACGAPLVWAPGRAAQECRSCDRWQMPPEHGKLISEAKEARSRVVISTGPTITDTAEIAVNRDEIIRRCTRAIEYLDTTYLQNNEPVNIQVIEAAARISAYVYSLIESARGAKNHSEIETVRVAFLDVYHKPETSQVIALIQQELRNLAQNLTWRNRGGYSYRVKRGTNIIERQKLPEEPSPQANTIRQAPARPVIQARPINPGTYRRAITARIDYEPGDDEYEPDDDEYEPDDDEYEPDDDEYEPGNYLDPRHPNYGLRVKLFLFLITAGACYYGYIRVTDWQRNRKRHICIYSDNTDPARHHKFRIPLARLVWENQDAVTGTVYQVFTCDSSRCQKRAQSEYTVITPLGRNYPPQSRILADINGFLSTQPEYTGVFK